MTSLTTSKMISAALVFVIPLICSAWAANEPSLLAPSPSSGFLGDDGSYLFNVEDYGATSTEDTDSSKAFLSAWEEACGYSGKATVYVPERTFLLSPIEFTGPCPNEESLNVEIRGTIRAPSELILGRSSDWIVFRRLRGIRVTGGNGSTALLDGQGKETWESQSCRKKSSCKDLPTSLKFINVSHAIVSNIGLLNSKGFHIGFHQSDNIDVYEVNITAPGDSPNTDGIHISYSTNISVYSSRIGVGDDCVSIGPGSMNISVSNIECGPGHGISVGSLGKYKDEENVEMIRVRNCTISGTQNGVRIKTWPGSPPGLASDIQFENITMINVSNPIIIDQFYCPSGTCKNVSEPSKVKLGNLLFKNITGTYSSKFAVSVLCSPLVPCENVLLVGIYLNVTKPERPDGDNKKDDSKTSQIGRLNLNGAVEGLAMFDSRF